MRTLLVIGGEGKLSGMMADRVKDDMLSLVKGLRDISQYRQLLIMPTPRFLAPPDDSNDLLPLIEFDEFLREEAMRHPDVMRPKVLKAAATMALGLFCEVLLSFTVKRQIVLMPQDAGKPLPGMLFFYSGCADAGLMTQRVEKDPLPLLGGVDEWPVVFRRMPLGCSGRNLLSGMWGELQLFDDQIRVEMRRVLRRCHLTLESPVEIAYPAIDALGHPRSLLARGEHGGFLLAMPRPSNLKNLSITLQTGKGIITASEITPPARRSRETQDPLRRAWMSRMEVAMAIGRSTDSVDNYCRDGLLQSYKVGQQVRITRDSVQRYLDAGK